MDKEGLLTDRGGGLEQVEHFVEKPDILDSGDPGGFGKTAFLEEVRVWYASGDGGGV